MCVLPPKTTLDYATKTMLTTRPTAVPPMATDEFMERRSDETGSFNGHDANTKVREARGTLRLFFQRFHPTYI